MFKKLLILLVPLFFLFSCSKKENIKIVDEPTEEDMILDVYYEAVDSLKKGDSYYAAKKFREVESLLPQSKWAAKASLMSGYADYSRNAYTKSITSLERYQSMYPADKNIEYAEYLYAIIYYEKILDKTKDINPLILAKDKILLSILPALNQNIL